MRQTRDDALRRACGRGLESENERLRQEHAVLIARLAALEAVQAPAAITTICNHHLPAASSLGMPVSQLALTPLVSEQRVPPHPHSRSR